MRGTWVKILAGLLVPLVALKLYASEPQTDPENWNDERYFESAYSSCLTRYQTSRLTAREAECVCDKLANYALEWRKSTNSGEPLPAAPQQLFNKCFE